MGAAWKYMIWGGIHGGWLVVERLLGKRSFYSTSPGALRVLITFFIVSIAWVFFLPETWRDAALLAAHGEGDPPSSPLSPLMSVVLYSRGHVIVLILAGLIAFFGVQTWDLSKRVTPAQRDCGHAAAGSIHRIAGQPVKQPVPLLPILEMA